MALTDASTLPEVNAQYENNCSYDLNGSVSECKLFIQAVRYLLRRQADEVQGSGGARVRQDRSVLVAELAAAKSWWMSNDPNAGVVSGGGNGVKELSFEEFR